MPTQIVVAWMVGEEQTKKSRNHPDVVEVEVIHENENNSITHLIWILENGTKPRPKLNNYL